VVLVLAFAKVESVLKIFAPELFAIKTHRVLVILVQTDSAILSTHPLVMLALTALVMPVALVWLVPVAPALVDTALELVALDSLLTPFLLRALIVLTGTPPTLLDGIPT